MPVASIPTTVTAQLPSQSASVSSPEVVLANSRISCRRPPALSGTRTQAVICDLWMSSIAQRSIKRSINPSQGSDDTGDRPGESHAVESESRAHGNSSGCPRLSRPTYLRACWHQAEPTSTRAADRIATVPRPDGQRRNNIFIRSGCAPPGAHQPLIWARGREGWRPVS